MARLDRLSGVKDVAHLAATLGRVFSHELLAAVSPLDEAALGKALDQLIDAELIYQRGAPPDVDLRVQARAGAGRRLQQPAAQQAPAAPPADRRRPSRSASARPSRASRSCSPTTIARRALPAKAFPYAMRAGDDAVAALRRDRGPRPLPGGARPRALAAALGERLAGADRGGAQARERRPEPAPLRAGPAQPRAGSSPSPRRSTIASCSAGSSTGWAGSTTCFGRFDRAVELAGKALLIAEGLGGADKVHRRSGQSSRARPMPARRCPRGDHACGAQRRADAPPRQPDRGSRDVGRAGLRLRHARRVRPRRARRRRTASSSRAEVEHLPTQAACLFFCGVVRGWHGELDWAGAGVRRRADPVRARRRHLPPVPDPRLARPGLPAGRPPRRGRGRPQALPRARRPDRHRPSTAAPSRRFAPSCACSMATSARRCGTAPRRSRSRPRPPRPGAARSRSRIHAEALVALRAAADRAGRGRHPQRDRDPGAAGVPSSTSPGRGSPRATCWPPRASRERRRDGLPAGRQDVRGDGPCPRSGARAGRARRAWRRSSRLPLALSRPAAPGRLAAAPPDLRRRRRDGRLMDPCTALLLGGGAPTLTLQSGALAALHEQGVKFDIVSTAGAGMLIGLLYAAPKGLSPAQALGADQGDGRPRQHLRAFPDQLQSLPQARRARRRLSPLAAVAAAHDARARPRRAGCGPTGWR